MTTGVVIGIHGQVSALEVTGLGSLQEVVGGWIECVYLGRGAHGYVNEEGKLLRLPVNYRATATASIFGGISKADVICGPMVILGYDGSGEERDAPAWAMRLVDEAGGGSAS